MSIGQAPLGDRLDVLRRLHREDHKEAGWEEDLRLFETAYLSELARKAMSADQAGDLSTLENVLSHLSSDQWTERPTSHIASVERMVRPRRTAFAGNRYGQIIEQLHQAFSRLDEQRCCQLMTEWRQVAVATNVQPGAAAAEAVRPVEAWLAEQERLAEEERAFNEACTELEAAVDEEATKLKTFECLAARVQSFERGIPEHIAARVASRIEELQRSARRVFTLRIMAVSAAAVVLCLVIVFVKMSQDRKHSVAAWKEQVAVLLQKGELEAAGKMLDGIAKENGDVSSAPEIEALRSEHARLLKQDALRQAELEQVMKNLDGAVETSVDSAVALSDRAEKLARKPEEKRRVLDMNEKVQELVDERQQKRATEINELITKLEAAYERVKSIGDGGKGFFQASDDALELGRQVEKAEAITGAQRARVTAIVQEVQRVQNLARERETRNREAQAALTHIMLLYGKAKELGPALRDFGEKFPEQPMAANFIRSSQLSPQWEALQGWAQMVASWDGNADSIEKRPDSIRAYLQEYPASLMQSPARKYLEFLPSRENAFVGGSLKYADSAKEFLTDPMIQKAIVVKTRKGRYYVMSEDNIRPTIINGKTLSYSLTYVADSSLKKKTASVDAGAVTEKPGLSPQAQFAAGALAALRNPENDWEIIYLRLAQQALAKKEMDPILCSLIVKTMLDYAADTTPVESKAIQQACDKLKPVVAPVSWMDPADAEAERIRPLAQITLEGLDLDSLVKKAEGQVKELFASLSAYSSVGIVWPCAEIELKEAIPNQSLYMVSKKETGECFIRKAGEAIDGHATIDKGVDLKGLCGSPVYVKTK